MDWKSDVEMSLVELNGMGLGWNGLEWRRWGIVGPFGFLGHQPHQVTEVSHSSPEDSYYRDQHPMYLGT